MTKILNKKIMLICMTLLLTILMISCGKTNLSLKEAPRSVFGLNEKNIGDIEIMIDDKTYSLDEAIKMGVKVSGHTFDKIGESSLVITYKGQTITHKYEVISLVYNVKGTNDNSATLDDTITKIKLDKGAKTMINLSGNVSLTSKVDNNATGVGNHTLTGTQSKELVIQGNGQDNTTLTITGTSYAILQSGNNDGTIIFRNLTLKDTVSAPDGNTWEWKYPKFSGKLVFENCTISTGIYLKGESNVSFKNCKFNPSDNEDYSAWIGEGKQTVMFEECEFSGYRGIKIHDYNTPDVMVTVNKCTFSKSEKPGVNIDKISTTSVVTITNNTFNERPVYESDTDISTYKLVEKDNK